MAWMRSRAKVEVFAVGTDHVQLTWSSWPVEVIDLEIGGRRISVPGGPPAWMHRRGRRPTRLSRHRTGPGAVTVGGLRPATTYHVYALGPARSPHRFGQHRFGQHRFGQHRLASFTTLSPPPGRVLARFATLNDLHVGERAFGARGTIEEPVPLPAGLLPYPLRCAEAAVNEAVGWGAELLVVKGDLTADSEPAEFREVGRVLAGAGIPSLVALGNHDVRHGVDGPRLLGTLGVRASTTPIVHDLEGARVIAAYSPHHRHKQGYINGAQRSVITGFASDARPAIVVFHHPPQRWRWPTHYPPGLVQPDSQRLLQALRQVNARLVVLAGHTHRNRSYRLSGVTIAEVGSTKDYPGQWAGYTIYEGGMTQVVYRIGQPTVIRWTEVTRYALGGIWGWWSRGKLADRCWSEDWEPSAAAPGGLSRSTRAWTCARRSLAKACNRSACS